MKLPNYFSFKYRTELSFCTADKVLLLPDHLSGKLSTLYHNYDSGMQVTHNIANFSVSATDNVNEE